MINELFPKTLNAAQLDEAEQEKLSTYLKNPEGGELDEGIKEKLESASRVLTTREALRHDEGFREFLLNDKDFRNKVKNERMGETLRGIDKANIGSWDLFDGYLTPEEIREVYGNDQIEKSTEKERILKSKLLKKMKAREEELEGKLKVVTEKDATEKNKTITEQSEIIESKDAKIKALEVEKQEAVQAVHEEYRLREVKNLTNGYVNAIKKEYGGSWAVDTELFDATFRKNVYDHFTTAFHTKANDSLKLELFQKDDKHLKATDSDKGTVLEFQDALIQYAIEYGALPRNNGQKAQNLDENQKVKGGPIVPSKKKNTVNAIPEGISPTSRSGKWAINRKKPA